MIKMYTYICNLEMKRNINTSLKQNESKWKYEEANQFMKAEGDGTLALKTKAVSTMR